MPVQIPLTELEKKAPLNGFSHMEDPKNNGSTREFAVPTDDSMMKVPRWKRAFDITLVILASPILLPVMILIALLIRIVSSGPVLFRQERIGLRGRRFMCLKFRTMFVGADTGIHKGHLQQLMNSNAPMVKMDSKGDPRLIPFGLMLRSCGLDELPQVFNVLFGDMSLVGPRPCVPYELEQYLPWQRERFDTVPGLTGLWQVSGKNRTTFLQMVQFDIEYVRNKSLWLDCWIVLKTIPALMVQVSDILKRRRSGADSSAQAADTVIPLPESHSSRRPASKVYFSETTTITRRGV